MNFTPLDSSRQRASFQIKFFAKFAKNIFFNFRRFFARKLLVKKIARDVETYVFLENLIISGQNRTFHEL
jgi:hypothetical protein